MALVDIHNLRVQFHVWRDVVYALRGVSMQVERGTRTAIVGESGSGKTVTATSMLRLLPPTARATAEFVARTDGVLAGRLCADEAFRQIDPWVTVTWAADDGDEAAYRRLLEALGAQALLAEASQGERSVDVAVADRVIGVTVSPLQNDRGRLLGLLVRCEDRSPARAQRRREQATADEVRQARRSHPRHSQAQAHPAHGERWQQRVQPNPSRQQAVNPRLGLVQSAPGDPRQPDRQRPHGGRDSPAPPHRWAGVLATAGAGLPARTLQCAWTKRAHGYPA